MTYPPYQFKSLKRPKYGNTKCRHMGMTFDSVLERDRWIFLVDQQMFGDVSNLARQVEFPLVVNGSLVCTMRLDFQYRVNGQEVVEDAKGVITAEWRIKQKLFEALHGKQIRIVTKTNLTSLP